MLYSILRVIVGFSLKIYFRKIDISGIEHLKPGKAQIIASNHPSGFLEPLIMACFFPRDLYFLVRGDLFENKIIKYFLEATHQIPIYRFKDGFSKLRNNADSIQAATDVLVKNKCLLIFVEGGTKSIKKLRPLQKGFVRMASEAVQKNPQIDLEILPLGINFSDSTTFRSEVMIKIQTPVSIQNDRFYTDNQNQTVYTNEIMTKVAHQMQQSIIHLDDQSRLEGLEFGFSLMRINHFRRRLPTVSTEDEYLLSCMKWAETVDAMDESTYKDLLEAKIQHQRALPDRGLTFSTLEKMKPDAHHYFWLILGFLPAIAGFMIHILPFALAKLLAKKLAPSREFFGSIWFVGGIVLTLLLYVTLSLIAIFLKLPLVVVLLAGISGIIADQYFRFIDRYYFGNNTGFDKAKEESKAIFRKYFRPTNYTL